jgi:transposase-like protein
MPFKETCPMEERIALLREYETGVFTVSELCRRHGISRETFYVWKRRRERGEARWFEELSHATASCPHATAGITPSVRCQAASRARGGLYGVLPGLSFFARS